MLSKEEIHKKKEEKSAGRLSSSVKKTQGAAGHNFSSSISTIRKELGIVKKTEISKKKYTQHNSLNKKALFFLRATGSNSGRSLKKSNAFF